MTGKGRLLTAPNRKEPDHAPTLEWVLATNVIEDMYGTRDPIDFAFKADLDGLAVSLDYKNEVLEAHEDGNGTIIRNEWGIVCKMHEEYPVPIQFPPAELGGWIASSCPTPTRPTASTKSKTLKAFGDEKLIVGRVRDIVSQPRDLLGYEGFLESFYTEPELVTRLMESSCDYSCRICENMHDLGIDVIVAGDDIADNNLLMSPKIFREMVLPRFTKLVQHAKSMCMKVIKHSDGNLKPVVEDLIGAYISAKNWKYFPEIHKELGQYPLNIELLERIAQEA